MGLTHPADFKNIIQLVNYFDSEAKCLAYLEEQRWNGKPVCPHCKSERVYRFSDSRRFKCSACRKQFTAKVGTYFESTKLPLQKWFLAIYLITAHKKGISSHQLARDLTITQKAAWFVLHRVRNAYGIIDGDGELIGGGATIVEVDETIVGGKVSNMHVSKRKTFGRGGEKDGDNKTIVQGAIERGGKLRLTIIDKTLTSTPESTAGTVDFDSVLMTDLSGSYQGVGKNYLAHETVDHDAKEYARDHYAHTNTLEGAFSLFDRMVIGIYHSISPKHMQKYLNEHSFRYNSRDIRDCDRMHQAVRICGARLKYATLIQKQKTA